MVGGLAVRGNLLCVTFCAARGHVFLFDQEAAQRVSAWTLPQGQEGYSDAAGVAMDEHFHLFVADPHNDRICHFSAFGRHLGDFGVVPPPAGDAGRDRQGVLDRPHAVAVHGDTVFVAMGERPRRRGVQRFTRAGNALRPLSCCGDPERAFGAPRALWADDHGLLVADTLRGTVQRFRLDGTFVAEIDCAAAARLSRPHAVVRLADNSILIADRGDEPGLARYHVGGRRLTDLGDLNEHAVEPIAIAVDGAGRVFVLDRGGERVQRFTAELRFESVVVDLAEHLDDFPTPP